MSKAKEDISKEKVVVNKVEKKATIKLLHLNKYLQKRQFNKMQIAAVGATLNKKTTKSEKDWDEEFNRVINKRLR